MKTDKERNLSIDIMRAIGLLLIVLAHVNPPGFLFQLRTFDVPLMVFVSGMAYYVSGKEHVEIVSYALSRFRRLVFPVWAFLLIFFSSIYIFRVDVLLPLVNFKNILLSFMLYGFGYVWVIRVFLIIALLSPLLVKISKSTSAIYFIAFDVIVSCVFLSLPSFESKFSEHILLDIIMPAVSYGVMFILGYKILKMSRKEYYYVFVFSAFIFLSQVIFYFYHNHEVFGPQKFKYPPTIYYISYAISVIFVLKKFLDLFSDRLNENGKLLCFIKFISVNTIWIYLWHIVFVEYFHRSNLEIGFFVKYLIAILLPMIIVFFQRKVILIASEKKPKYSKLIREVFTG